MKKKKKIFLIQISYNKINDLQTKYGFTYIPLLKDIFFHHLG